MSKTNHDEYVAAAKEIASCLGVNLHDLISRTTPILEFSPVPIRPAVEVFLSTFAMITEVQDQFSQSLRLISRCAKLLKGIREHTDGLDDLILPPRLAASIHSFERLLMDVQVFIQDLTRRGWFKRLIYRHKIRAHLDNFDVLIDELAQEFGIRSHLVMHARLTEEIVGRQQDATRIRSMLSDALDNDETLLRQLQQQRMSIQSLEDALNKHMAIQSDIDHAQEQQQDNGAHQLTQLNQPKNKPFRPTMNRLSSFVNVYNDSHVKSSIKRLAGV